MDCQTKVCSACKIELPTTAFGKDKHESDGLTSACKKCRSVSLRASYARNRQARIAQAKAARLANIEKERARYKKYDEEHKEQKKEARQQRESTPEGRAKANARMREWRQTETGRRSNFNQDLKQRCGMTIEQYDEAYERQQGCCKICGSHHPQYSEGRLTVDHCHSGGHFRALLCGTCNAALGMFREDENILMSAINYVREFCKPAEKGG